MNKSTILIAIIITLTTNICSAKEDSIQRVKEVLAQAENMVDFARSKLTIDNLVDPRIDIEATLKVIEGMVSEIKSALPKNVSDVDKMLYLRSYLYEKGEWNNYIPFSYDFDDPLGQNISSKLLPQYLRSKKGNCISMPMLFIILGDRLGLKVYASTAPLHVFVKFTDPESRETYNLETTNRAQIVEQNSYLKNFAITKEAINNDVYLKPLSKKETVAVMAIVLSEYYASIGKWEESIKVADLVLKQYPNYAYALIKKGNGYSGMLREQLRIYSSIEEIPKEKRIYFKKLAYQNNLYFSQAEKLGWREESLKSREQYLNSVSEHKNKLN